MGSILKKQKKKRWLKLDEATVFWFLLFGAVAIAVYYFIKKKGDSPSGSPAPDSLSVFRGYPKFIDLRNLKGGRIVKNGVVEQANGKLDVSYKKGLKTKNDTGINPATVLNYTGHGDFPNGLIVVLPIETLARKGDAMLNHWLNEYHKLDLQISQMHAAYQTLLTMQTSDANYKYAMEQAMRQLNLIEQIRRPLTAETERARRTIELQTAKPEVKKETEAQPPTNLGIRV